MPRRRQSAGERAPADETSDVVGDAFQQVSQGLARLQEVLRPQGHEADRRMQEALHLQIQAAETRIQEALRLEILEAETRIQEALRLQIQEVETRMQEALRLQRQETRCGSQGLEERVNLVEGSLQSALKTFFPRVDTLLRQLQEQPTPGFSRDSASTSTTTLSVRTRGSSAAKGTATAVRKQTTSPGASSSTAATSSTSTGIGGAAMGWDAAVSRKLFIPQKVTTSTSTSAASEVTASGGVTPEQPLLVRSSSTSSNFSGDDHERAVDVDQFQLVGKRKAKKRWRPVSLSWHFPPSLDEDLCYAAEQGNVDEIQRLICDGADVNYIDRNGYSPLTYACRFTTGITFGSFLMQEHEAYDRKQLCIEQLIDAGADVNARNEDGETALHWAVYWENFPATEALVLSGARIDLKPGNGGFKNKTPIDLATSPILRDFLRY